MKTGKYIFIIGAPGSKWSSVSKNIYFSESIDRSDASKSREYYHDAPGTFQLMHMGAYFDPMMEFGHEFDDPQSLTKEQLEKEFDRPFSGEGKRIIKCHSFANNIDYIKETFPDCPIVLVHRDNDACLGWWVKCGHFEISYPKYDYYVDLKKMARHISMQNRGICEALTKLNGYYTPHNNIVLANLLHIKLPPEQYRQNYTDNDIKVYVI